MFLHESPGLPADLVELSEHFVFFADQSGVERDGRFAGNEARLYQSHGEMEALGKRARLWRMLKHAAGVLDDGCLDLD